MLTTYDWHGNYGHPTTSRCTTSGTGRPSWRLTPRVLEATMNRDHDRAPHRHGQGAPGTDELVGEAAEEFDPNGPADDGNPFGTAEAEHHAGRRRRRLRRPASGRPSPPTAARSPTPRSSWRCPRRCSGHAFGTEWYIEPGVEGPVPGRAGSSPEPAAVRSVHLVRHGRAAAGWDDDPDPPLDDVGRAAGRAVAERAGRADPGGRRRSCQPAAALPARPRRRSRRAGARTCEIEPLVAEIPSPEGVPDGGAGGLAPRGHGRAVEPTWARATSTYRDAVVGLDSSRPHGDDGRGRQPLRRHQRRDRGGDWATTGCVLRSLDNCSVTSSTSVDGAAAPGRGRARGRHAHPLTGPGWRRERAERGARTTSPSACGSARARVAELPAMLRELGLRRVVLVTSAGRADSEDGERVARRARAGAGVHLRRRGTPPARRTRSGRPSRPPRARVPTGRDLRAAASVVDCGKAVAFFVEQQAGTPGQSVLDRPGARPRRRADHVHAGRADRARSP